MKDHYSFTLNCKIGLISIFKDELSFKACDTNPLSPRGISNNSVSNVNTLSPLSGRSSCSKRSISSDIVSVGNMNAVDKLLLGD